MNDVYNRISEYIKKNKMLEACENIIVGLSGGADSVCLIRALAEYLKKEGADIKIHAVHVNHGIRNEAADDEEFSKKLCEKLGIEFESVHIDAVKMAADTGMTLEEAGRKARYDIFEKSAKERRNAVIAVAHHMNDQAETVIMNMVRGSSIKGIGGMQPVRDRIIRPLLCVTRKDIEGWLSEIGQNYVTDQTNYDNEYTRNCIRNIVIPYLTDNVNAKSVENISRLARDISLNEDYITGETKKAFDKCVKISEKDSAKNFGKASVNDSVNNFGKASVNDSVTDYAKNFENVSQDNIKYTIDLNKFNDYHEVIKKRIIYRCLVSLSGRAKDVYSVHVDDVYSLNDLQVGKRVDTAYGITAQRTYDAIILSKKSDNVIHKDDKENAWSYTLEPVSEGTYVIDRDVYFNGEGYVHIDSVTVKICENNIKYEDNNYTKTFDYDTINNTICFRFRKEGDRIAVDDNKKRKLKKEFIDRKIPKEYRNDIMLVCNDSDVLWALGIRRCEDFKVDANTGKYLKITFNAGHEVPDKGGKL